MRYVSIAGFGTFVGLSGSRLVVKNEGEILLEVALSRLRVVSILKEGVSLSSDLIQACAIRGIKIFFLDWRNRVYSSVIGNNQNAVVAIRKAQFRCIDDPSHSCFLSKRIILSKIKNQRAVLLYFGKYLAKNQIEKYEIIKDVAQRLSSILAKIYSLPDTTDNWRSALLGFEGSAANLYWSTLQQVGLFADDFCKREGRNAVSITNKALNYGYAILLSYIWSAIDNAGLEVYAGIYHVDRPGKPSLVLDLMEEYRAWVVDRVVIKLREQISQSKEFDFKIKKKISNAIHDVMATKYLYNKKKVKLENIIQRQVYRFAGNISKVNNYKGYSFKW